MNITEMLLTPNQYSRPQTSLKIIKGVVVHYVGNPNSTALANRNYFESLKTKRIYASSHYIIGLEGEVIRCIPETEIAYCSNNRNSDTLSIECCHPLADGKFTEKTYQTLIALLADISKRYSLNPLQDIIRHYDITKKACPLYYVNNPDKWESLKRDVQSFLQGQRVPEKGCAYVEINGLKNEIQADNMVEEKKIKIDQAIHFMHMINHEGYNYVKLQDLGKARIEVSYDTVAKLPILTLPKK